MSGSSKEAAEAAAEAKAEAKAEVTQQLEILRQQRQKKKQRRSHSEESNSSKFDDCPVWHDCGGSLHYDAFFEHVGGQARILNSATCSSLLQLDIDTHFIIKSIFPYPAALLPIMMQSGIRVPLNQPSSAAEKASIFYILRLAVIAARGV